MEGPYCTVIVLTQLNSPEYLAFSPCICNLTLAVSRGIVAICILKDILMQWSQQALLWASSQAEANYSASTAWSAWIASTTWTSLYTDCKYICRSAQNWNWSWLAWQKHIEDFICYLDHLLRRILLLRFLHVEELLSLGDGLTNEISALCAWGDYIMTQVPILWTFYARTITVTNPWTECRLAPTPMYL